jgi:hypothetical protein
MESDRVLTPDNLFMLNVESCLTAVDVLILQPAFSAKIPYSKYRLGLRVITKFIEGEVSRIIFKIFVTFLFCISQN